MSKNIKQNKQCLLITLKTLSKSQEEIELLHLI